MYGEDTSNATVEESEDMRTVRGVFDKALNAIVESTKLAQEVADLRVSVKALKDDVDYLRETNSRIDEHLTIARRQRDEAEMRVGEFQHRLNAAELDLMNAKQVQADTQQRYMEERQLRIEAIQECEALRSQNEDLQSMLNEAETKLGKIQSVFAVLKVEEPVPELQQPRNAQGQFQSVEEVSFEEVALPPGEPDHEPPRPWPVQRTTEVANDNTAPTDGFKDWDENNNPTPSTDWKGF